MDLKIITRALPVLLLAYASLTWGDTNLGHQLAIASVDSAEKGGLVAVPRVTRYDDLVNPEDAQILRQINSENARVSSTEKQLASMITKAGRSVSKLQKKYAISFMSRGSIDRLLLETRWYKLKSADLFFDHFKSYMKPSDATTLRKLLKNEATPDFERRGNNLFVRSQGVELVADISELSEHKVTIDGVVWIFDPKQALVPQIGILLKKLHLKDPLKYAGVENSAAELYANQFHSAGAIPEGVEVAQVQAVEILGEAGVEAVDLVAPKAIPAVVEKVAPVASHAVRNILLFFGGGVASNFITLACGDLYTLWTNSNCAQTFLTDFADVPPGSTCSAWASRQLAAFSRHDNLPDPDTMGTTDEGNRIISKFEGLSVKCPQVGSREYRGYMRIAKNTESSEDQTNANTSHLPPSADQAKANANVAKLWNYVVLDTDVQNGKSVFVKMSVYDPSKRPFYDEAVPAELPAVPKTNTTDKEPPDATCTVNMYKNICCEMKNPLYAEESARSPRTAQPVVSHCLGELDTYGKNLPIELKDELQLYHDLIPYIEYTGIGCSAIAKLNKGITSETGGKTASPAGPVNIIAPPPPSTSNKSAPAPVLAPATTAPPPPTKANGSPGST